MTIECDRFVRPQLNDMQTQIATVKMADQTPGAKNTKSAAI